MSVQQHDKKTVATFGPEWFLKTFPRFSTEAVVAAREGKTPKKEPAKNVKWGPEEWRKVTRSLSPKTTRDIFLHVDMRSGTFEFRDHPVRWQVSEQQLADAIASGGEFVGMRFGAEILRLKRSELNIAFNELREKLKR